MPDAKLHDGAPMRVLRPLPSVSDEMPVHNVSEEAAQPIMALHDSPQLQRLLNQPTKRLTCPKCGGTKFGTRYQPARPEVRIWRWVILSPQLERMLIICAGCDYRWDEPVGRVWARGEST